MLVWSTIVAIAGAGFHRSALFRHFAEVFCIMQLQGVLCGIGSRIISRLCRVTCSVSRWFRSLVVVARFYPDGKSRSSVLTIKRLICSRCGCRIIRQVSFRSRGHTPYNMRHLPFGTTVVRQLRNTHTRKCRYENKYSNKTAVTATFGLLAQRATQKTFQSISFDSNWNHLACHRLLGFSAGLSS